MLRRLFLLAAILAYCHAALANGSNARPNIVYILADDLGYGDVHAMNPQRGKIRTPHLDRLAAEGKVFTDAHSGSSVCTPTRYGILTGRYAWRTRLQAGVLDGIDDPPLIAKDRLTVPALLKQHGYTTACLGKWHLGFESRRPQQAESVAKPPKRTKRGEFGRAGLPVGSRIIEGPLTRGFDYFWGCSNARTMASVIENAQVVEELSPREMLPRLGKQAVKYVESSADAARHGRPFFLYLPLTAPHTPILPAAEWQGRSGLGDYGDFVMQTDAVVGEVLDALDRTGLTDDTLVVFTSDNGCSPQAGVDALERQGHFPSADFRGYKADIWDGGHRVPFLVRWPGQVQAGSTSSQLICLTDLMATCAELLNVRLPDKAAEDSVSILPALVGTDDAPLREAVVHHSIQGKFAIRKGPWKLELCAGSGGWGKPSDAAAVAGGLPDVQLYHLESDAGEQRNLSSTEPEAVARLRALLEEYVARGRSTPGEKQQNDVEIVIDKPNLDQRRR